MDPRVRLEMGGLGLLLLLVGGRCRGGVQIDGFTTVNLLFCGGRGGRWMDSRVAGSLLAQVMQVVQVVQDSMIARMPHPTTLVYYSKMDKIAAAILVPPWRRGKLACNLATPPGRPRLL